VVRKKRGVERKGEGCQKKREKEIHKTIFRGFGGVKVIQFYYGYGDGEVKGQSRKEKNGGGRDRLKYMETKTLKNLCRYAIQALKMDKRKTPQFTKKNPQWTLGGKEMWAHE